MDPRARLQSQNLDRFVLGKKLTDKRIDKLIKDGFYSPETRQARSEFRKRLAQIKAASKREGNFVRSESGSLIYSPL